MSEEVELETRLRKVLSENPWLKRHRVDVRLCKGKIVLSGKLDSFFLKQCAQEAMRAECPGSKIQNEIVVE